MNTPPAATAPKKSYPPPPSLWDLPAEVFAPGLFNYRPGRPVFLIDRFWQRVPTGDGCWLWPGETRSNGYGLFEVDLGQHAVGQWAGRWGVRFRAHRFAWESIHGPIPAGLFVLHKCDCRRCCRPDHLFLGTTLENSHDMRRKGRGCSQSRWFNLSADRVQAIRARLKAGEAKGDVAKAERVSPATVDKIRLGRSYRWVPELSHVAA